MTRPRAMFVVRALLAVAMLVGFYLVGLGTVVVLVGLSVWLWWVTAGDAGYGVSAVALAAGLALLVSVWLLLRARPQPLPGVPVTPQRAPQLWALVRELAAAVGTRMPDEIVLVPEANAAVWQDTGLVGLSPGRRYLYVGVPLLEACTVSQIRAVLAHELGHYAYGHTRLGAVTYRGMVAITGTIDRLGPRNPIGLVMIAYGVGYAAVSLTVRRRMETEADQAAAQAAGREAIVSALRDSSALAIAWEAYLDSYLSWIQDGGYEPEVVLDQFRAAVRQRAPQLERAPHWLKAPTPARWDAHPPVEDRIALLGPDTGDPAEPDQRPAALLVDCDARCAVLRTAAFDEHIETIAQLDAHHTAKGLYRRAGLRARVRSPTLGTVLDLLATDGTSRLAGPEPDGWLAETLLSAVNATLVVWGDARWRHVAGQPIALINGDDALIDARPVVLRACQDSDGVRALRGLLHERGVPMAVTTDSPAIWRGQLPTLPLRADEQLLLPDQLFLLAHHAGPRSLPNDILDTGLAAGTLAELRLRRRITVADTSEATLAAIDLTPTGNLFLDGVLRRIGQEGPQPAYQWLLMLGPDIRNAVCRRTANWEGDVDAIVQQIRSDIIHALRTGDLDARCLGLGAMLWGTELIGPVLGWRSSWSRFWLGRLARQDRLAVAIRTVTGLTMPLPHAPNAGM